MRELVCIFQNKGFSTNFYCKLIIFSQANPKSQCFHIRNMFSLHGGRRDYQGCILKPWNLKSDQHSAGWDRLAEVMPSAPYPHTLLTCSDRLFISRYTAERKLHSSGAVQSLPAWKNVARCPGVSLLLFYSNCSVFQNLHHFINVYTVV